jgi:hypothetical protein
MFDFLKRFRSNKKSDAVQSVVQPRRAFDREARIHLRENISMFLSQQNVLPKFSVGKRVLINISKGPQRGNWTLLADDWKGKVVTGEITQVLLDTSYLEELLNENTFLKSPQGTRETLLQQVDNNNYPYLLHYCDWSYKIKFDDEDMQVNWPVNEYWLIGGFDDKKLKEFKRLQKRIDDLQLKMLDCEATKSTLFDEIFKKEDK